MQGVPSTPLTPSQGGEPEGTVLPPSGLALRILFATKGLKPVVLPLRPGPGIDARLLGTRGAALGKGPLAAFDASEHNPHMRQVRNRSRQPWRVIVTGRPVEFASGESRWLAAGDEIDFGGGVKGVIEVA